MHAAPIQTSPASRVWGPAGAAAPSETAVADQPLVRVAALLLSISRNNGYEGRDPATLPDALRSGFVADLLGVDIATLAGLLVDLRRRGIVECGSSGSALVLKDIGALERIAN